jgi:DNA repair photolyase
MLIAPSIEEGLALAQRVDPRFAPVWQGRPAEEQAALAWYFLPHRSSKAVLAPTRPRVIKWYCPFADQREFPSGHRYCINVYTGCAHKCEYCYAAGYEPQQPGCKKDFERLLQRDLDDLEQFDVPLAPVHLSNSTDAFQPLEMAVGQTRVTLEWLARHRHRFTTVTVLTKNPLLAAQPPYTELLQRLAMLPADHPRQEDFVRRGLPALRVEVSLAFWQEEARRIFDPGAPPVAERIEGIRRLRQAGVPVVLRIDPLLPRGSLNGKTWTDFGLPEPQTADDLDRLLAFAAEVRVMHVVYSVAKLPRPRNGGMSEVMTKLMASYRQLASSETLNFRGGSWRLPDDIARSHVVEPFLVLCRRHGLTAQFCKQNLIKTP